MNGLVQSILGMRVVVHKDHPRYTLPDSLALPCGHTVEWPAGFRDEFNGWSRSFLGYSKGIVADGQVFKMGDDTLVMNERTYAQVKASFGFSA
jgi:hypothetical protein